MPNKLIRMLIGGEWINITLHDGRHMWIRPTFPECTKSVCEYNEDENYPHSFGDHQVHLKQFENMQTHV